MYIKRTAELGAEWWVYDPLQVGTDGVQFRSIECYPNPVNSTLFIVSDDKDLSSSRITVYNMSGIIVKKDILSAHCQLDVHSLVQGSYYFEIKDGKDQIYRSFFLKK